MRPDAVRASMDGMSDDVMQIEVGALPLTLDDSVVLLDVREPDEWQRGHVTGAQHIPMADVPARIDEIDRDATLYVICHAGGRSQRVAQYLARNGFEPINVTGGMLSWAQAGRPVRADDGSAGTV
ncbi:rhodanese-like domain-containing protein [Mycolicibacterium frederiksbergense]